MQLILLVVALALVLVGGSFVATYYLNKAVDQSDR